MKKLLLIILLLISIQCFSQNKVYFADYDGNYTPSGHDYGVKLYYKLGYESSGRTWDTTREVHNAGGASWSYIWTNALNTNEYSQFIRCTNGFGDFILGFSFQHYPQTTFFYAPNQYVDTSCHTFLPFCFPNIQTWNRALPNVVLCGVGIDSNTSAYNVEFYDTTIFNGCGNCPSFSIPYIAGKIMAIRDARNCSMWEARYCARMTTGKSYNEKNGYGRINVANAIAYSGTIPPDPYILHVGTIGQIYAEEYNPPTKFDIPLYATPVSGVKRYEIFINDVYYNSILSSVTSGNYLYINTAKDWYWWDRKTSILPRTYTGFYKFQYRGIGQIDTTAMSEPYYVRFRKYDKILTR